ncbi:hypothetical protein BLX88_01245, partial [Bacillus obstructivus]
YNKELLLEKKKKTFFFHSQTFFNAGIFPVNNHIKHGGFILIFFLKNLDRESGGEGKRVKIGGGRIF